ncbi:MAG: substrate-binding domain-containing protein, partial [Planctomycetes bacterium]|nr:substrate-binding domain-containing protein [Planctomycetota bacterium]
MGRVLLLAAVLAGLVWALVGHARGPWGLDTKGGSSPLVLWAAASQQAVLEEALLQFSEETGVQVQVQYGGSGTLLGQFLLDANGCDVFLPADDSFVQAAKAKHRVAEIVGLAHMTPVIGVASGNPQGVGGLQDL